jgi:hypothetical protein
MEEELLKKYNSLKNVEKNKTDELAKIKNEVTTLKAIVETTDKKIVSDFEFWYDVMKRKLEYTIKTGNELTTSSKMNESSGFNKSNGVLQEYTEKMNKTNTSLRSNLNNFK